MRSVMLRRIVLTESRTETAKAKDASLFLVDSFLVSSSTLSSWRRWTTLSWWTTSWCVDSFFAGAFSGAVVVDVSVLVGAGAEKPGSQHDGDGINKGSFHRLVVDEGENVRSP